MKNYIAFGLLLLFATTGMSQIQMEWGTRDSLPWFKLDHFPGISKQFKTNTHNVYKAIDLDQEKGWIRDSMFYKKEFLVWEKTITNNKGSGLISSNIVRTAKRKNPGNHTKAILQRHQLYHRKLLSKLKKTINR